MVFVVRVSSSIEQTCAHDVNGVNLITPFHCSHYTRKMSSASLSSLDSIPVEQEFDGLYQLLDTLKTESKMLHTAMKSYNKRYIEIELSEQSFHPKASAKAWFVANNLPIPCSLELFLKKLFSGMAKQRRMCPRTRTLLLNPDEAEMFGLQPFYAYKWLELLKSLPAVFH